MFLDVCTALASGSVAVGPAALQPLADAAGGPGNIDDYCGTILVKAGSTVIPDAGTAVGNADERTDALEDRIERAVEGVLGDLDDVKGCSATWMT